MINELLFLSHNDIPFPEGRINIHSPEMNEIALIGEKSFNIGCRFLNFSKNLITVQDNSNLENMTDFEIFMSVMNTREKLEYRTDTLLVLSLLFPAYEIKFEQDKIVLKQGEEVGEINKDNYSMFKDIIQKIFCLEKTAEEEYNPADGLAKRIADKLKKRHEQLNHSKSEDAENIKVSIYMRYISILAVGLRKDINELMHYNIYQLNEEFIRFQKKQDFDMYIKAKMAGASDLEDVDNWMGDLHS